MGQNLSRKTAAKRIFLSYLNLSKKSETIQVNIGLKVAVTVKISAHLELHNNEKSNRAQTPYRNKIPDQKQQLFQTKMGKTWHFIKKNPETKLKTKSLVTSRGHKENKK